MKKIQVAVIGIIILFMSIFAFSVKAGAENGQELFAKAAEKYASKEYADALKYLDRVNISAEPYISDAEYYFLKADVLAALGKRTEAIGILKKRYFVSASAATAEEAIIHIEKIGGGESVKTSTYLRSDTAKILLAKHLLGSHRYQEALRIIEGLHQKGIAFEELLADASFRSREYDKAKGLYQKLAGETGGNKRLFFLVRQAQSYARTNDFASAIRTYQEIIKEYGKGPALYGYLYKIGFLKMDSGDFKAARDIFQEILGTKDVKGLKKKAVWYSAWCAYRAGMMEVAADEFGESTAKERYWRARALEQANKSEEAKQIYLGLADSDGFGYYGTLAARKLKGDEGIPKEKPSSHERRGKHRSGKRSQDQPLETGALPYSDVVNKYIAGASFDANFVLAIMKQESHFRPNAVSKAGAVGLMQMIPPTADRIAKELSEERFNMKMLTVPAVSIKFGVQYLKDLSEMFGDEKIYMLASYNAGEDAVTRWKSSSTVKALDEFVEEIPYSETNNYVKKVLADYWAGLELK